jgi:methylated-DNA-[protein]-cysteine S-methyltransferase
MKGGMRFGWPATLAEDEARASAGFSERALRDGLVDVGVGAVDSPIGRLLVAASPRGLVRVAFPEEGEDAFLEELASRISPRVLEAPSRLEDVRRQLDEYFEGHRRRFEVPVDWQLTRGFVRRVLRATARIPYGRVSTYRDVAGRAGNDRAMRAAGNALAANPIPIVVPCHRVIRTGGGLGGYGGRIERKRFLLELEGAIRD